MKIGYDAKKIVRNTTGIGNYSRGVVQGLSRYFPDNEYLMFAPTQKNSPAKERLVVESNMSYVYPRLPYSLLGGEFWRMFGVASDLRTLGVDIFHGLSNELPMGIHRAGCKAVVTIHDLIFLRLPSTYSLSAREILKAKTRYACSVADAIVAISQRTKDDVIDLYGIDPAKIHLVYQGCDPIFSTSVSQSDIDSVRERYGIGGRYILSVGTIQERKNQLACVEALRLLPDDVWLVLVGKGGAYAEKVSSVAAAYGLSERVMFLSNFPHPLLPALIKGCSAFIYPSRYEGFGIPILEAMTVGVPVIAASGSCLEEVGGDSALYFHPDDCATLATHIHAVLSDQSKAESMVEAARVRLPMFSQQTISSDLMSVYNSIL